MLQSCQFVSTAFWDLIQLACLNFILACPGSFPCCCGENHNHDPDPDKPGCTMSCKGNETDPTFWIVIPYSRR